MRWCPVRETIPLKFQGLSMCSSNVSWNRPLPRKKPGRFQFFLNHKPPETRPNSQAPGSRRRARMSHTLRRLRCQSSHFLENPTSPSQQHENIRSLVFAFSTNTKKKKNLARDNESCGRKVQALSSMRPMVLGSVPLVRIAQSKPLRRVREMPVYRCPWPALRSGDFSFYELPPPRQWAVFLSFPDNQLFLRGVASLSAIRFCRTQETSAQNGLAPMDVPILARLCLGTLRKAHGPGKRHVW